MLALDGASICSGAIYPIVGAGVGVRRGTSVGGTLPLVPKLHASNTTSIHSAYNKLVCLLDARKFITLIVAHPARGMEIDLSAICLRFITYFPSSRPLARSNILAILEEDVHEEKLMKTRLLPILLSLCLAASASGQNIPPPNINPTTELAISILNSYGLPTDILPPLVAALRAGDADAQDELLGGYNLSDAQTEALTSGLSTLLDSGGLEASALSDYAAYQFFNTLSALGIATDQYAPFFRAVDNPEDFADLLTQLSLPPEEVDFFKDNQRQLIRLGLDEAALDNYLTEVLLLSLLADLGVPEADLPAILNAYNDDERAFTALLSAANIDIDAFIGAYDSAYFDIYFGYGFSSDDLIDFNDAIFVERVAEAAQDPLLLRKVLVNYGYTETEIAEFISAQTEGTLDDLLARYGFDTDDASFDAPPDD